MSASDLENGCARRPWPPPGVDVATWVLAYTAVVRYGRQLANASSVGWSR